MHRLAVVAMAVELHDRLSADFDLDRVAAALDLGHSFSAISAAMARSRAGRSSRTVSAPHLLFRDIIVFVAQDVSDTDDRAPGKLGMALSAPSGCRF
jgi:hypothetical protein